MPGVSIGVAGDCASASRAAAMKVSRPGPSTAMTRPGLVQNCPEPMVSEPTNARAEVGAAGGQRAVEQEDRVDRAHLGVDRDRLGPGGRGGDECRSAGTGSGEADGLDARVGHQGDAEFGAGSEEQREGARGQARGGDGVGDGAADELGGAGVGVVAP